MKLIDNYAFLYLEPDDEISEMINDKYVLKMHYMLNNYITDFGSYSGIFYKRKKEIICFSENLVSLGVHNCTGKINTKNRGIINCNAKSNSYDVKIEHPKLPKGIIFTNSLCLHYLTYHRVTILRECPNVFEILDNVVSDEEIKDLLPLTDKEIKYAFNNIPSLMKKIEEISPFNKKN